MRLGVRHFSGIRWLHRMCDTTQLTARGRGPCGAHESAALQGFLEDWTSRHRLLLLAKFGFHARAPNLRPGERMEAPIRICKSVIKMIQMDLRYVKRRSASKPKFADPWKHRDYQRAMLSYQTTGLFVSGDSIPKIQILDFYGVVWIHAYEVARLFVCLYLQSNFFFENGLSLHTPAYLFLGSLTRFFWVSNSFLSDGGCCSVWNSFAKLSSGQAFIQELSELEHQLNPSSDVGGRNSKCNWHSNTLLSGRMVWLKWIQNRHVFESRGQRMGIFCQP
jgi:hypothetical protein